MDHRVLIVDDEHAITEGLVTLFEMEQIDAAGAFDRESAEAMLESESYSVVLADLRLVTEEDGLKLLSTIRERYPKVRVASLTAFATPQLEAQLQQMGSAVVLRKPMEFDEIIAVVRELLAEIETAAAEQVARSGQPLDLVQLYGEVQRILYSIPQRRYHFSAEEAEELVQEAWCLFLQKQGEISLPRPWLAGTIANLCKQQIQRNTRERATSGDVLDLELGHDEHDQTDASLMVRQALSRIDERSRQLCVRIGLEGKSYEEVSQEMGLPIGSVGPLYIRSKEKLRKALVAH